ncbi:MAG: D-alanyl-D-alanine carboxypeptidase/D-alanyl-D-alanine endopeptidase [Actinomycetes bacterium]
MAEGSRRRGRSRVLRRAVLATVGCGAVAGLVAGVLALTGDDPAQVEAWKTPAPVPAAPALSPLAVSTTPPSRLTAQAAVEDALAGVLDDPALGARVGVSVLDASGEPVYERDGGLPIAPASTIKTLTAAAVLETVGPDARLTTSVVSGEAPDEVVLVGGGDPTLTREPAPEHGQGSAHERTEDLLPGGDTEPARLPDLAADTAAALREQGTTSVRLRVDDTLFTGPTQSPTWPSTYVSGGYVAPVTALAADAGGVTPGGLTREADPPLATGALFAELLEEEGIEVRGGVSREVAPPGAERLARVQSQPVATLVETMLEESDNDIAETLLRHAARSAGHPASFSGGEAAVSDVLTELDVDPGGLEMYDGSGLSREDRVPPRVLARTLATAAHSAHGDLRPLVSGLPVAGFTGTLGERFSSSDAEPAAGVVRAKTGTLTGVSALTGLVQDRDGRLLVFAVLTDGATSSTGAEAALDEVAAALASCGCVPAPTASPSAPAP